MAISPTLMQLKLKQLFYLQIQSISLSKYSNKYHQPPCFQPYSITAQDDLLSRLRVFDVLAFEDQNNGVMQAFAFVVLRSIYGEVLNEDLLKVVKMSLYEDGVDLTAIKNGPICDLDNNQIKKLIVQFMVELYFTNFNTVFFKKIQKHPVIIPIFSLFLRCVLLQLGMGEASDYENHLPFDVVVELLCDFFNFNFRQVSGVYLFGENDLFLWQKVGEKVLMGVYGKSNDKRKEINMIAERKRGRQSRIIKLQRHVQSHQDLLRQSSILNEQDIPTPSFSLQPEGQQIDSPSKNAIPSPSYNFQPSSPFSQPYSQKNNSFFPPPSHLRRHYGHATTPSGFSLDDEKLHHFHPQTYYEQGQCYVPRNKVENRFGMTLGVDQIFFGDEYYKNAKKSFISMHGFEDEEENVSQYQYECCCKSKAKLKTRLYSNVYSLAINQRSSKSTTQSCQEKPQTVRKFLKPPPFFQFKKSKVKEADRSTNNPSSPLTKTLDSKSKDLFFDDLPDNICSYSELARSSPPKAADPNAKSRPVSSYLQGSATAKVLEPVKMTFTKPKIRFNYGR